MAVHHPHADGHSRTFTDGHADVIGHSLEYTDVDAGADQNSHGNTLAIDDALGYAHRHTHRHAHKHPDVDATTTPNADRHIGADTHT